MLVSSYWKTEERFSDECWSVHTERQKKGFLMNVGQFILKDRRKVFWWMLVSSYWKTEERFSDELVATVNNIWKRSTGSTLTGSALAFTVCFVAGVTSTSFVCILASRTLLPAMLCMLFWLVSFAESTLTWASVVLPFGMFSKVLTSVNGFLSARKTPEHLYLCDPISLLLLLISCACRQTKKMWLKMIASCTYLSTSLHQKKPHCALIFPQPCTCFQSTTCLLGFHSHLLDHEILTQTCPEVVTSPEYIVACLKALVQAGITVFQIHHLLKIVLHICTAVMTKAAKNGSLLATAGKCKPVLSAYSSFSLTGLKTQKNQQQQQQKTNKNPNKTA